MFVSEKRRVSFGSLKAAETHGVRYFASDHLAFCQVLPPLQRGLGAAGLGKEGASGSAPGEFWPLAAPRCPRVLPPPRGSGGGTGLPPFVRRPAAPSLSLRVGKLSSRCGGLPLARAPEEEEEEGGRGRVNALRDLTSDFRCSAHPPLTDTRTHALGPLSFLPHPRSRRGHRKGQMSGCTLSSALSTLTLPAGRAQKSPLFSLPCAFESRGDERPEQVLSGCGMHGGMRLPRLLPAAISTATLRGTHRAMRAPAPR